MRKIVLFAAAILLMASCGNQNNGNQTETPIEVTRDSLHQALADQDSLLVLMTEIQQGLNDIKALENILNTGDLTNETTNRREDIRNDMRVIQETLHERSKRLAELEARLNKANSNNAHLQKAIATLREQISQQEATISSLRDQLAAANIHIDELTSKVDTLNQVVEITNEARQKAEQETVDLTNELNTCYYVIGNDKELKKHNIIDKGFLRKTKVMPEDFEKDYFTRADKRTLSELPLNSKKAKLLTNQPASSYRIVTNENGMKMLDITDPEAFWSISNYVVIQID